jgi:hypothetical protein
MGDPEVGCKVVLICLLHVDGIVSLPRAAMLKKSGAKQIPKTCALRFQGFHLRRLGID